MNWRFFGLVGAALIGALAGQIRGAEAQTHSPVVIELYTSQGCVSCPPADDFMGQLARRDDVIALALHVDYWDYLGWADPFAQPAFTERQKRYARAHREKMIYTPQFIVGGQARVQGYQPQQIAEQIARRAAENPRVDLRLEWLGEMVRIEVWAEPPLDRPAVVQLVRYLPEVEMTIERGENAGRTAAFHNVVTEWRPVSEWAGTAPLVVETPAEGDRPVVVIVQENGPGRILAAGRLR
ncbi:MAG: DUF1223 domain-containing protein [Gemmobacter sp.]